MAVPMDTLVERLDAKLQQWKPDTAEQVRQWMVEIIDLADQDALGVMRSRSASLRSRLAAQLQSLCFC